MASKVDETINLEMVKKGFSSGFPIMLGYFPVAVTYGVLAKQAGLSLVDLTLMSILVYAGASQFMGINMIAAGTGVIEIAVATFVLNFRHFVMSLSFMNGIKEIKLKWKLLLSLGLTDETFAVSSLHNNDSEIKKGPSFYVTLFICAYLTWVIGSFFGGLLGEVIPETLSQSMGIALYAMFIGLLVPSVKKELKIGFIAIIAMMVNLVCSQFMSSGWAIVLGTIIGGFSGVFLLEEEK